MKRIYTPLSLFVLLLVAGCATQPPVKSARMAQPGNTPPAAPQSHMQSPDRKALLDYHNKVRADVGVAPLIWDETIAAFAQQWADQRAGDGCSMKHRQPNTYGENLFQGTAGHYKAVDAAKGWESEKQLYHGETITAENYGPIGHYTQMVWRNTTRVGCGEATCSNMLIVVCNYDPPGNYLGQKPY